MNTENADFEKISLTVLKLISEKDMYGYEIIYELKRRSENTFAMNEGGIYPMLHLLEEKNILRSYNEDIGGKTVKYYRIASKGKKLVFQNAGKNRIYKKSLNSVVRGEFCDKRPR